MKLPRGPVNGKELAATIFGQDLVDRDWAGYELGVELMVYGECVSYVGMTNRTILVNDEEWPVAGIGFVCTKPIYRGLGLATKLMTAAHSAALQAELPWAVLDAIDTPLYRRLGYWHPPNLAPNWWVKELDLPFTPWPGQADVDLQGRW